MRSGRGLISVRREAGRVPEMRSHPDSWRAWSRPACESSAEHTAWREAARRRQERSDMERIAIIARLKEGSEQRATELVEAGPPIDLAGSGIARHNVYLSSSEVAFVFEGHQVEWIVDELIDEPFNDELRRALDQWREIVTGQPRIAREQFGWRLEEEPDLASAHDGSGS